MELFPEEQQREEKTKKHRSRSMDPTLLSMVLRRRRHSSSSSLLPLGRCAPFGQGAQSRPCRFLCCKFGALSSTGERAREREMTRKRKMEKGRFKKIDCGAIRFLHRRFGGGGIFDSAFFETPRTMIVFFSVFFECVAAIAQIFLLCFVGALMEKIVSAMRLKLLEIKKRARTKTNALLITKKEKKNSTPSKKKKNRRSSASRAARPSPSSPTKSSSPRSRSCAWQGPRAPPASSGSCS